MTQLADGHSGSRLMKTLTHVAGSRRCWELMRIIETAALVCSPRPPRGIINGVQSGVVGGRVSTRSSSLRDRDWFGFVSAFAIGFSSCSVPRSFRTFGQVRFAPSLRFTPIRVSSDLVDEIGVYLDEKIMCE